MSRRNRSAPSLSSSIAVLEFQPEKKICQLKSPRFITTRDAKI